MGDETFTSLPIIDITPLVAIHHVRNCLLKDRLEKGALRQGHHAWYVCAGSRKGCERSTATARCVLQRGILLCHGAWWVCGHPSVPASPEGKDLPHIIMLPSAGVPEELHCGILEETRQWFNLPVRVAALRRWESPANNVLCMWPHPA